MNDVEDMTQRLSLCYTCVLRVILVICSQCTAASRRGSEVTAGNLSSDSRLSRRHRLEGRRNRIYNTTPTNQLQSTHTLEPSPQNQSPQIPFKNGRKDRSHAASAPASRHCKRSRSRRGTPNPNPILSYPVPYHLPACIPTPGSSLSSGESTCYTNCMEKYMAAWNTTSRQYLTHVQKGAGGM
jgi:import inner membrane translocase subunit TIM13